MNGANKDKAVNLETVKKLTSGNMDLVRSIISIYADEVTIQLKDIENAIVENNPVGLDNAAHKFKSSLASLGGLTASDIARQLEMLGKSGSVEGAAELFKELKKEEGRVSAYFKSSEWLTDWGNAV